MAPEGYVAKSRDSVVIISWGGQHREKARDAAKRPTVHRMATLPAHNKEVFKPKYRRAKVKAPQTKGTHRANQLCGSAAV